MVVTILDIKQIFVFVYEPLIPFITWFRFVKFTGRLWINEKGYPQIILNQCSYSVAVNDLNCYQRKGVFRYMYDVNCNCVSVNVSVIFKEENTVTLIPRPYHLLFTVHLFLYHSAIQSIRIFTWYENFRFKIYGAPTVYETN